MIFLLLIFCLNVQQIQRAVHEEVLLLGTRSLTAVTVKAARAYSVTRVPMGLHAGTSSATPALGGTGKSGLINNYKQDAPDL